jgi:hypothetical protein
MVIREQCVRETLVLLQHAADSRMTRAVTWVRTCNLGFTKIVHALVRGMIASCGRLRLTAAG